MKLTEAEDGLDVLIVDRSAECREVLRTLLEIRGMRISEAAEARRGLEMIDQRHPQLIILDTDTDAADDEQVRQRYGELADRQNAALLVIGRAQDWNALPPDRVVSKPYHYGPLIRTIEQLLRAP